MLNFWSQFEEAWRDTLVHKAEGQAFAQKARLHGFPWPQDELSEQAWRGALHPVAYGPRGSLATVYWALEAAFSDYNETIPVYYDAADPYVLNTQAAVWLPKHVNRLFRTKYGLLWSDGNAIGEDTARLVMARFPTTYWDGLPTDIPDEEEFDAIMLPFVLRERTPGWVNQTNTAYPGIPCEVEVVFYSSELSRYRPTYLCGAITKWQVTASSATDRFTFPVAHGLSVNDPVIVMTDGVFGSQAPAPLEGYTVYYVQSVPTATTITVKATIGGGLLGLDSDGTGTFYIVDAQPTTADGPLPAGHLLATEMDLGNPTGTGPYPCYLDDSVLFASTLRSLDKILAAGCRPVVGWHPLLDHNRWTIPGL